MSTDFSGFHEFCGRRWILKEKEKGLPIGKPFSFYASQLCQPITNYEYVHKIREIR